MTKTIENLFLYLHYTADILPILLFLIFFKSSKKEKALVLITLYIALDLILNLLNGLFSNTLYLYIWSTFTLIEYSIFTYVIWINIKKLAFKRAMLFISLAFILFTAIFNIHTNFKEIDSIPISIETILILLFSFYYLYEQMNDTSNLFIYSKYQFWIVIGFMIYLAGSFFVYLFASRMAGYLLRQYWMFTNSFYFLMSILFGVAFIIHNKKKVNKPYSTSLRPSLN